MKKEQTSSEIEDFADSILGLLIVDFYYWG